MEASDTELLRDYVRNHSELAFRTLVERHIDVVYAVASRQTGNWQLAQDVTQAVFIVLAQKAASLPTGTVLAGWLFRATRYAAANARRAEARREHWEQKAAQMEPESSESELEQVEPLLFEALEQLPETDRAAILLRFFERKSMEEVGRTLGTTEAAAKMRLARAVEKLRHRFRKHGVAVPTAVVMALLSAQAAQGAPAGLAASIATSALLNQSSASTLLIAKGILKVMAQAQAKKLAAIAAALVFAGAAAVVIPQSLQEPSPSKAAAPAREAKVPAQPSKAVTADSAAKANSKVLVFRNKPSWNRNPDFEDRLEELGMDFEVKPSSSIESTDLSAYRCIIIPGGQWRTDFYQTLMAQAERFDRYVTNGGVLALELNGAEDDGILLPRGVSMARHGSVDNTILVPDHPALAPFTAGRIRANYASHGFLEGVPADALVLAAETVDDKADVTKPTYVEYAYGKGRVIAACQCFHDQDKSGRGVIMPTLLTYAVERRWYVPKTKK